MTAIDSLVARIKDGDQRALARAITVVENELSGHYALLQSLTFPHPPPVVGITGPPGAGKSTLVNNLVTKLANQGLKIAVITVDPSSPFNYGALLGDRIRLNQHYENPNIFIRSLASRGSLGGLSHKAIEVVDLVKAADFDYILVETVGVGQSEVEIAGLSDTTVVVLVPEAGDDVQTMKAGLLEVADIFVVNKADRSNAAAFVKHLKELVHGKQPTSNWQIPVLKTVATTNTGIDELEFAIQQHLHSDVINDKKVKLVAAKAYDYLQRHRMKDVSKELLQKEIEKYWHKTDFNVYDFMQKHYFHEHEKTEELWKNRK